MSGGNHIQKGTWEQSKKKEKNRSSILDGVPRSLPSLLRSRRIQEKASSVGFDWKEVKPIVDKVKEELNEVQESINQEDNTNVENEVRGEVIDLCSKFPIYKNLK